MLTQHLSTEAYQNIHSRSSNNAAADDVRFVWRKKKFHLKIRQSFIFIQTILIFPRFSLLKWPVKSAGNSK